MSVKHSTGRMWDIFFFFYKPTVPTTELVVISNQWVVAFKEKQTSASFSSAATAHWNDNSHRLILSAGTNELIKAALVLRVGLKLFPVNSSIWIQLMGILSHAHDDYMQHIILKDCGFISIPNSWWSMEGISHRLHGSSAGEDGCNENNKELVMLCKATKCFYFTSADKM